MKRVTVNIVKGVGSVLVVAPDRAAQGLDREAVGRRFAFVGSAAASSDAEALRADVQRIGEDFRKSVAKALHD